MGVFRTVKTLDAGAAWQKTQPQSIALRDVAWRYLLCIDHFHVVR